MNKDDILNDIKIQAYKSAYILLKKLMKINKNNKIFHKIATGESITGGLIFSTLVDIPFAGSHKYGSFIVYDMDAKHKLLNIKVNDPYTHKCVKEMAEGVLKNSNASIAIAVSGNARPNQDNKDIKNIKSLGKVFIGIAGYGQDNKIICETKLFNFCSTKKNNINDICNCWISEALKTTNDIKLTSFISNYIRIKTVESSLNMALRFINKNNLIGVSI